jgi:Thiolase-like protein type 1 additional C-terminal domain
MTRQLRQGKGANGLVLANGGVLTYQHVICLSSQPRRDGSPYPDRNPLPDAITDVPVPLIDEQVEGEATVEVSLRSICSGTNALTVTMNQTYTVEFNRDATPLRGHLVGRLKRDGHRFIANHGDASTLQQLSSWSKEPIGRSGRVEKEKGTGRNLFTFEKREKL